MTAYDMARSIVDVTVEFVAHGFLFWVLGVVCGVALVFFVAERSK